ncbi:hypothetical protein JW977_04060 [Candidatus Falkowbacteria bacterium]|nr:hypothetical protein [Candidatus Falkowbacteria bacterium]
MDNYVIQVNVRLKGLGGENQYISLDVTKELHLSGDKSFNLDTLWLSIEKKLKDEYGQRFDRIVNVRITKEHDADIHVSARSADLRPVERADPSKKSVTPIGIIGARPK